MKELNLLPIKEAKYIVKTQTRKANRKNELPFITLLATIMAGIIWIWICVSATAQWLG